MPLGQAVLTSASPIGPGQIALFIIGMIAIIAAAYYSIYYLGSRSSKLRSGRNIVLRDRFAVSKDKSFYVIEAYGKIYIVGVTNHSMLLLDTLDAEAAEEFQGTQKQPPPTKPAGLRQNIVNGMADFISARIIKRDGMGGARGGASDDLGDSGFNAVYKEMMTKRDDEPRPDAEDEE